jgi:hypothetical protein
MKPEASDRGRAAPAVAVVSMASEDILSFDS